VRTHQTFRRSIADVYRLNMQIFVRNRGGHEGRLHLGLSRMNDPWGDPVDVSQPD